MIDAMRRRPLPTTLAWAAQAIATEATVVGYRRLIGGITSSMHRLTIENRGSRRQVVLRRWIGTEAGTAAIKVEREAAVLGALAGTGIHAPELIATSAEGVETDGCPSLLMTRVPGRMNLTPADSNAWIGEMAAALPYIHSLPLDLPRVAPWRPLLERGVPTWSRRPELWLEAIVVLGAEAPAEDCFIHNDFQHFNLLWRGDRLI